MSQLQIYVGTQHDGYTFSLRPRSADDLKKLHPDVSPLPRVFIGFDTKADFEKISAQNLYEEIALLLTRLSKEELERVGFEILDPVGNKSIFAVNAQ